MLSYLFGMSRRWEMMFLLMSGVLVVYTLRVNISVAAPKMAEDLGWSETEKGLVLSSFYWGYAAGQLPASRFAQYHGAKWMFGLSVLIPSILTLFVPMACRSSLPVALFLRCILGFFESASFPAVFYFYPIWIPADEKTIMVTTINLGMYIGEIVGFSLSGVFVDSTIMMGGYDYGSWPSVFYFFGLLGIVWFPLWAYFAYESPESHPYITADELAYMQGSKGYTRLIAGTDTKYDHHNTHVSPIYQDHEEAAMHSNHPDQNSDEHLTNAELAQRTPWLNFFTHKESITLFLVNFVYAFIGFMLLSEMPSYLNSELGFDISSAGILCIVPYAALFFATLGFGKLFDYLQHHKGWEVRTVRQVAQFIALGGPGIFLIICGFTPKSQRITAFAILVVAQALLGVSQSGLGCAYLDLAPRFSSPMNSVGNTIGAIAGICGPLVVADFTGRFPGVWGWRAVFILTAVMCTISLVLWRLFQSSTIHPALNTPLPKK